MDTCLDGGSGPIPVKIFSNISESVCIYTASIFDSDYLYYTLAEYLLYIYIYLCKVNTYKLTHYPVIIQFLRRERQFVVASAHVRDLADNSCCRVNIQSFEYPPVGDQLKPVAVVGSVVPFGEGELQALD